MGRVSNARSSRYLDSFVPNILAPGFWHCSSDIIAKQPVAADTQCKCKRVNVPRTADRLCRPGAYWGANPPRIENRENSASTLASGRAARARGGRRRGRLLPVEERPPSLTVWGQARSGGSTPNSVRAVLHRRRASRWWQPHIIQRPKAGAPRACLIVGDGSCSRRCIGA
eukprot:147737-Prymnesium_polylepis.1